MLGSQLQLAHGVRILFVQILPSLWVTKVACSSETVNSWVYFEFEGIVFGTHSVISIFRKLRSDRKCCFLGNLTGKRYVGLEGLEGLPP